MSLTPIESAEMPFIQERQRRLLRVHRSSACCVEDTMNELYDITRIDYNQSIDKQIQSAPVEAASELMLKDYELRSPRAIHMLRSVAGPIVDAMIDNTLGHRYSTEVSFRMLFLKNHTCAGIYLNTWVVKGRGKCLNIKEWKKLRDMMKRYVDSEGVVVSATSSQSDINAALEAARIDKHYSTKHFPVSWFENRAKNGHRDHIQKSGRSKAFYECLSKRIRPDLDPSGDIYQLQSPVQVGCSRDLFSRTKAYDLLSDEDVEIITVPILYTWQIDDFSLGEILITALASSMIEWGGYNPIAAGAANLEADTDLSREAKMIFVHTKTMRSNLDASMKTAISREAMLTTVQTVKEGLIELENDQTLVAMETQNVDNAMSNAKKANNQMAQAIADTKAQSNKLLDDIGTNGEFLKFAQGMKQFLG